MAIPVENTLTFDDFLGIAKRRLWQVVVVFLVVFPVSVLVVNSLPPRYRSAAIVSVESQQISAGLVQSTVSGYVSERIEFIRQRVMTGGRLLEIIDKFQLFPKKRSESPESVLISELRDSIYLDTIKDPAASRAGIVAFELAFEHREPEIAAAVATELVTMFLEENVRARTGRAIETTDFLKREAIRVGEQMREMEGRVAAFKRQHSDTLPEHLELRMNMLQRMEGEQKAVGRDILALEEEKRFLEMQRVSIGAILSTGDRRAVSPAQQLAALKGELIDKSAVYGASHPDLKNLRRRIAVLGRQVKSSAGGKEQEQSSAGLKPAETQLETQLISANKRLASLRAQKQELQAKMEGLQARIIATPQVEMELRDLTRDYSSASEEYEEMRSKQRDAELSEHLEEQEKAERFVLLEAPQVPSVPVWPEKRKAYALGFVLAVGSGGGMAFLAESLDKTIRGSAMLASISQRHPLAVIPIIESSRDRRDKRVRRILLLFGWVFIVVVGLVIIHFYYHPLDVLMNNMLAELVLP